METGTMPDIKIAYCECGSIAQGAEAEREFRRSFASFIDGST